MRSFLLRPAIIGVLVLSAPTWASAACDDKDFVEAMKTQYHLTENEELWQRVKRVACKDSRKGFVSGGEAGFLYEGVPIQAKGHFDYNDVKTACDNNDEAFFRKYARILTVRFLPKEGFEVLKACPENQYTHVNVEAKPDGSCDKIRVKATFLRRDEAAPQEVKVIDVDVADSFTCDTKIGVNKILKAERPEETICRRTDKTNHTAFGYSVTTNPYGVSERASINLFQEELTPQKGMNLHTKTGAAVYRHFEGGNLESCREECGQKSGMHRVLIPPQGRGTKVPEGVLVVSRTERGIVYLRLLGYHVGS